jgi:serine/threonine-protein kinase ATR
MLVDSTAYGRSLQRVLPTAKLIVPLVSSLTPINSNKITAALMVNAAGDPATATFGSSYEMIGFDGKAVVLKSQQKPKKISIRTRDGRIIPFLFKSRDEPRKDFRMMDMADLVNKLFLDDAVSRRKGFALRRYAVAALSQDTAIIEWVENTMVLRRVVDGAYALDKTGVTTRNVQEWLKKVDSNQMTMRDMFQKHIFPATPPVMHQWLQCQFQQCAEWYAARSLFTQSCALWSIVGHILGVGDRHAENIMINLISGEVLHVDFAYLFDKGETLKVPEKVRFRLTQNLVDGMGVVGADGPFRSACATALRTQVRHRDTLMTILNPLLHDPLVEWVSGAEPRQLFARVARRLDGYLDLFAEPKEKDTFALSIDGQIAKLIHHSTALDNLAGMYVWWMAWI